VNAFTTSRSFEINALQQALRSSRSVVHVDSSENRAALAQRAFQDVPPSLRRRSASHNVKRVPRPLRAKAAREMVADGIKPSKKPCGRRRLAMERKRLFGKISAADQLSQEMSVDKPAGIPKLKPRSVPKGKFSNRQG